MLCLLYFNNTSFYNITSCQGLDRIYIFSDIYYICEIVLSCCWGSYIEKQLPLTFVKSRTYSVLSRFQCCWNLVVSLLGSWCVVLMLGAFVVVFHGAFFLNAVVYSSVYLQCCGLTQGLPQARQVLYPELYAQRRCLVLLFNHLFFSILVGNSPP